MSDAPAPKVVRIKRLQIGVNVLIQLITLAVLVIAINYLGFNHYKRWDFSRNHRYALSDKTKRVLRDLKKPVKIIVFFSGGIEITGDVENLLKEYQYASRKNVEVETVDPARNFTRARELQTKYKFGANENILILDYDGRSKFVNASDMADYDQPTEPDQPPRLIAFKGEQTLTSALLQLTETRENKVYFMAGHGEPALESDTISALKRFIMRDNIKPASLNLMNTDRVPEDTGAVIIMGPKYDFSEREMKLLSDYWEKKGRIFLMLDPSVFAPRLTAFLNEVGIKPDDDRVLTTRTMQVGNLNLAVVETRLVGSFVNLSPITKRLGGVNCLFMSASQSLTLDNRAASAKNIHLTSLVEALTPYWGETDYADISSQDSKTFFDAKRDKAPPLVVAVSAEKGALSDQRGPHGILPADRRRKPRFSCERSPHECRRKPRLRAERNRLALEPGGDHRDFSPTQRSGFTISHGRPDGENNRPHRHDHPASGSAHRHAGVVAAPPVKALERHPILKL